MDIDHLEKGQFSLQLLKPAFTIIFSVLLLVILKYFKVLEED